jgi:chromosome segregation ATPase
MEPVTLTLICSAVAALLGGAGTAVYLKDDKQKAVKLLQDQIHRLQKHILALQSKLADRQREIAELQSKLAARDAEIARLLAEQIETRALIDALERRIEQNSRFWAKIVALLQLRLGKLNAETVAMREQLAESEAKVATFGIRVTELEVERARFEAVAREQAERAAVLEGEIAELSSQQRRVEDRLHREAA